MSQRKLAFEKLFSSPVKDFTGVQLIAGNLLIDTEELFCLPLSEGSQSLTEELNTMLNSRQITGKKPHIQKLSLMQAAIITSFAKAAQEGKECLSIEDVIEQVRKPSKLSDNFPRSIKESMERIDLKLFGVSEVIHPKRKKDAENQSSANSPHSLTPQVQDLFSGDDLPSNALANHTDAQERSHGLFARISEDTFAFSDPVQIIESYE